MDFNYKNTQGTCLIDKQKGGYFGYVLTFTDYLITYEGTTKEKLFKAFKKAVDNYISEK